MDAYLKLPRRYGERVMEYLPSFEPPRIGLPRDVFMASISDIERADDVVDFYNNQPSGYTEEVTLRNLYIVNL
jgi:hypothetical protein